LIKNKDNLTKNIYESNQATHSMIQALLKQTRIKYGKLHLMNNKNQMNEENQKYTVNRNEMI